MQRLGRRGWAFGLICMCWAGLTSPAWAYLNDEVTFPDNAFELRVSDLVSLYGMPSSIQGDIYIWRNRQGTLMWSFTFPDPDGPMQHAGVGVGLPTLAAADKVFNMWRKQAAQSTHSTGKRLAKSAGTVTYKYIIPSVGAAYVTLNKELRLVTYTIIR